MIAARITWGATIYGYEVLALDGDGQIVDSYSGANEPQGRSNPHIYATNSLEEIRNFATKTAFGMAEDLGLDPEKVSEDPDIAVAFDADYGEMCRVSARAAGMPVRRVKRF